MTCKHCGRDFKPYPGKPGFINECVECASDQPEKVGGITVWEGKHTPVMTITTMPQAKAFYRSTRRFGAGVMAVIAPKGAETGNPGTKAGSGAEKYAGYTSKLGEKRQVKS